jgi:hypothetical protein
MTTAGYKTSDASNRRKRGLSPCLGMPMIIRSTPTTKRNQADCDVSKHFKHWGLLSAASPVLQASIIGPVHYWRNGASATNIFTANLLVQARQIV